MLHKIEKLNMAKEIQGEMDYIHRKPRKYLLCNICSKQSVSMSFKKMSKSKV